MKKMFSNFKNLISKMDKPLLIVTIIFFVFGLLNITTASSREAVVMYEQSTYHYFFRQAFMIGIGIIAGLFIINLSTKTYKKLIVIGYIITALLVVLLFPFGDVVNGAKNWLPLVGGFSIQPSEIAKLILIILYAVMYEQFYKVLKSTSPSRYKVIALLIVLALIIPFMTFLQVDTGGFLIMLAVFGIMFLASPIRKLDKVKIVGVVIGVVLVGMASIVLINGQLLNDAQLERFNYFNPCSKYENEGYQVCNSFIALNEGGLFGVGIGGSKQKYSYIPEPHTDSIFAIIGEEQGAFGVSLVFIGYAYVIYRIFKIANKTTSIQNYYICIGVATNLFLHIFINLGGLLGLIPLTGVPLPFLSYGGTYAIVLIASLAIVQRINIECNLKKKKKST